jgi:hypothetical protein
MQRHWSGWRGPLGKCSPRWIVGCWPATERVIRCTSWSSPRRSYRFRCWSTPSRARRVGCFAGTGQTPPLAIAMVFCGRWPISLRRLAALRWRSSSSMSSNRQRASSSPLYGGVKRTRTWVQRVLQHSRVLRRQFLCSTETVSSSRPRSCPSAAPNRRHGWPPLRRSHKHQPCQATP